MSQAGAVSLDFELRDPKTKGLERRALDSCCGGSEGYAVSCKPVCRGLVGFAKSEEQERLHLLIQEMRPGEEEGSEEQKRPEQGWLRALVWRWPPLLAKRSLTGRLGGSVG